MSKMGWILDKLIDLVLEKLLKQSVNSIISLTMIITIITGETAVDETSSIPFNLRMLSQGIKEIKKH